MAARRRNFVAVLDGDTTVGLYICRTEQQAIAEHIKPLRALVIDPLQAADLMTGEHKFIPIEVKE